MWRTSLCRREIPLPHCGKRRICVTYSAAGASAVIDRIVACDIATYPASARLNAHSFHERKKMPVDGGVVGKLRMKRGGQDTALLDQGGLAGEFGQHLDPGRNRFDDWSADKDHLERL